MAYTADLNTENTQDFLRRAAWLGFSRSMIVGSILQAILFLLAPVFPGSTLLWRVIFGFTALTMLGLSFLCRYFPQLYKYIYSFLFITLGLAQLEGFLVLWGSSSTVAAISAVNLLAGFGILSLRFLSAFLALTSLVYAYWLWNFNAQDLLNTSSSIYLLTLAYAYVMHFRFKKNLLKQLVHAQALEKRTAELERLHQKYERLSQIDELTQVFNRRYFMQELERYNAFAKRDKLSFSILIFDLDHFKTINDAKGHIFGDKVLQDIALRVKQSLRETDVLARYGGEEFVVLLPFTSLKEAEFVAERIRCLIAEKPVINHQDEVWVSSSFGLANSDAGIDLEFLLLQADKALYKAKEKGRNRVEVAQTDSLKTASTKPSLSL